MRVYPCSSCNRQCLYTKHSKVETSQMYLQGHRRVCVWESSWHVDFSGYEALESLKPFPSSETWTPGLLCSFLSSSHSPSLLWASQRWIQSSRKNETFSSLPGHLYQLQVEQSVCVFVCVYTVHAVAYCLRPLSKHRALVDITLVMTHRACLCAYVRVNIWNSVRACRWNITCWVLRVESAVMVCVH